MTALRAGHAFLRTTGSACRLHDADRSRCDVADRGEQAKREGARTPPSTSITTATARNGAVNSIGVGPAAGDAAVYDEFADRFV